MCQKCHDALRKYYPDVVEEEAGTFLMCVTAFPFGDGDIIERQLREAKENTDGSIEAAYAYADAQVKRALDSISHAEEGK